MRWVVTVVVCVREKNHWKKKKKKKVFIKVYQVYRLSTAGCCVFPLSCHLTSHFDFDVQKLRFLSKKNLLPERTLSIASVSASPRCTSVSKLLGERACDVLASSRVTAPDPALSHRLTGLWFNFELFDRCLVIPAHFL